MSDQTTLRSARLARFASVPALIVVTGLLGGCTLFNRGAVRQPGSINIQSEDGSGQIDLNNGSVTFQGNDDNSQSSFSFGGTSLAEGWPSSLPTPDNATVAFSGKSAEEGKTTYSATFSSNDSGTAALANMKSKFESAGWTVAGDYSANYGGGITGGFSAEQGANSAVVVIASDTSSSTAGAITITVSGTFAE